MSLIALLGEPQFWFDQNFNSGAINLGRYRDIASVRAGVKGRCRIGYVAAADQDHPAQGCEGVLMTFEEVLPVAQQNFKRRAASRSLV